jgi:hypothetical protein
MPISVTCPCGKSMKAKDEWAGKRARCPACQRQLTVPDPSKGDEDEEIVEASPVEEEDIVEAEPVRKSRSERLTAERSPAPRSRGRDDYEDEEDDRPRRRRDREEDEDDRPRGRRSRDEEEDEDDRPRRGRRRRDDRDEDDRPVRRRPKPAASGGGFGSTDAGLWGGVAMMVIAAVWFVLGLYGGRIFFYPPILFVLGLAAMIKGMMDR